MMISGIAEWLDARKEQVAHGVAIVFTTFFSIVAFPPYDVGEAAFVFLVPFVIWLRFRPSYRKVALTSFLLGWVVWLVLIFWLRHVTWAGMIALSSVVGAHFALWAIGARLLVGRFADRGTWSGIPITLGAGALWVAIEHLRGWIFTGFPWLPLSTSQWSQPIMLQSADVFGAWGISFSLVILNFGVAGYFLRLVDFAKTRKKGLCPEFYVALSIVVGMSFMQFRQTSNQERETALRAGVMQPAVPQEEKWDSSKDREIFDRIERQTVLLGALRPDAIFWPEAVLPYPLNDDSYVEAWGERLADEVGVPILAGSLEIAEREGEDEGEYDWFNSVFLVQPELGLFQKTYSKRHLVPFGEYIPWRDFIPFVEKVVPLEGDILPGKEAMPLPLYVGEKMIRVGALICFEDLFPNLARDSVKDGAGMFFVASNSAWFGQGGAAMQHMAHSVMRAVETRRIFLRVGNDGWTGWIDEYGAVHDQLGLYGQEWTVWDVDRDRRWVGKITPYVRYGDWFAWLCWLVSIGLLLEIWWERRKTGIRA